MAKQPTSTGEPAKQVAIDILRQAGEPLHAKEIAKRVIESGRTRLAGKTPEQTITAMLAVGSKPSGPFTRVDKGTYTLAGAAVQPQKPSRAQKPKRQPPRTRQAATPAKPAKEAQASIARRGSRSAALAPRGLSTHASSKEASGWFSRRNSATAAP